MKRIFKNKKILFIMIAIVIVIGTFLGISYSEELQNDVEVTRNSILTYYLDVTYDGIDRNGVASSDTTVSSIRSGYMEVKDKIPDGLTFEGFITTSNGTIGAVRRNDENTACTGRVVDDTNEAFNDHGTWNAGNTEYTYHGLHYDASTRTVSFKVYNLQAGCKLTVGIITRTPAEIDDPTTTNVVETRRDFYNFGNIIEKSLSKNSNTVHVYMGNANAPLYNVTYSYTGTVPSNAPAVPSMNSYAQGATVGVANDPLVEGYSFSGWTTSDATVSNGSFVMPNSAVTLTGSFTEKAKKNVRYTITGTSPDGYVVPLTKNYYQDAIVDVDSLSVGDVFNGYRFLGWGSSDVTISDDKNFVMPNQDVTLVGSFEPVTYTVTYAFYDGVLPPNSDTLLPADETYSPGDIVTLPTINEPNGYQFFGWYKEDNFIMPDNDITVYGEWGVRAGTFEPTIAKAVTSSKSYYREGDVVTFRTTVTNTAAFTITDVIVSENNTNAVFTDGTGYEIVTDHFVKIPTLASNASIDIYSSYTVHSTDTNTVTNEVELVSALAGNGYILYDKDYKATVNFNIQPKVTICKTITGPVVSNKFQIKVTGTGYETWVVLDEDECKDISVDPGTYTIKEVIPQEYELSSVTGISSNGGTLTVTSGVNSTITFTNRFKNKGFYHSSGRVENTITSSK